VKIPTGDSVEDAMEIASISYDLAHLPRHVEWSQAQALARRVDGILSRRLGAIQYSVMKFEAARVLGLTDETVTAWIRRGILRSGRSDRTPKETVDFYSLVDIKGRIERLRAAGVTDKAVWAKLLAAGLGEDGAEFTPEDLEIIRLNRTSRGRGLVLPRFTHGTAA
jgi:hypothetical protein